MVIKRRKNGPFTVTINTRTGKQTTSTTQKTGNIRLTHSTSNDGSSRRITTTGYGDGWFSRKYESLNKKGTKKKGMSWFGKPSSSSRPRSSSAEGISSLKEKPIEVKKEFYETKSFSEFTFFEWILWLGMMSIVLPVTVVVVGAVIAVFVEIFRFIF